MPLINCWVVTEGHIGMENQCAGVAEALSLSPILKRVKVEIPWKYLPGQLWWRPLAASGFGGDRLEPPWPDILITCGWKVAALSAAVRRASRGKTFTVHIQDPQMHPRHFDLVAAPRHDGLHGENVILTLGAPHRVTDERLGAAARRFGERLVHLPRPLLAVLIGGSNRCYRLTAEVILELAQKLKACSHRYHAGLAITASRRTGAPNEALLRQRLRDVPAVIWDGGRENPYFGYLALADAIAVTCDSVSMVSEAGSTGKPVYVIDLEGGSRKFRRFHDALRAHGVTRRFTGDLDRWDYTPLDDTTRVANEIRRRIAHRFELEGEALRDTSLSPRHGTPD